MAQMSFVHGPTKLLNYLTDPKFTWRGIRQRNDRTFCFLAFAHEDVLEWLQTNHEGRFTRSWEDGTDTVITFLYDNDAIIFKLTWAQDFKK